MSNYSNPTPDPKALANERMLVQKKTFTRWTNHFLSERVLKVEDLFVDLQDGIMLINLLEIISSKSLGRYDKKPRMELTKLGNLNVALDFIKSEGLKLVNIGAKDIHDAVSPKLILGLIWTLILRYQIQMGGDGSPKSALLEWVNNQIKPYAKHGIEPVNNFTNHWQDGRVICALADSIAPGLIDVTQCRDPITDWQKALDKSLEAFEIPHLVDAVDCVNNPDEHSLMTYVSCFRDYLENKAKDDEQYKLKGPRAQNCFATGKGVMQPGPCFTNRPLPFEIFGRNKDDQPVFGKFGPSYTVTVKGPNGVVPCDVKECEDSLHKGSYTVDKPGNYGVDIILDGRYSCPSEPIKGSTYQVVVHECTNAGNSFAKGPGLTHSFDDMPAHFTVHLNDINGQPVVGEDMMDIDIKLIQKAGPTSAAPSAGAPVTKVVKTLVPASKFCENCGNRNGGTKFCESCGTKIPMKEVESVVNVPQSAIGAIAAAGGSRVQGPVQSEKVPVKVTDNQDGTYAVEYQASIPGEYTINVTVANEAIRDMPSRMTCSKGVCGANTWADGRGVNSPGFINRKMPFVIHTHDRDNHPITSGGAQFKVNVNGPNGPIPCTVTDNGDGTYSGVYEPKDLGDHVVDIRVDKGSCTEPIRDNPFRIHCKKGADPMKSWAEGEGLTSASDNRPAFFTVHAIDEDNVPVSGEWVGVNITDQSGKPADFPLEIKDNGDGTYAVEYQATTPGDYNLEVVINDEPIKDMPTKLHVHPGVDAAQTVVTGPGVEGGTVNKDLPFTVFAKDKNGKPVEKGGDNFVATVQGPNGPVPCQITDNGDGTYSGAYRPTTPGDYTVSLAVNDQATPVGNSPYHLTVKPGGDPKKSYAKGKGWRYAYDNSPAQFKVYVKDEEGKAVAGETVKVVFLDKSSAEYKAKIDELVGQVDEYMLKKKADMNSAARAARVQAGEKVDADEGDVPVTVVDNGDGSYTVTYVAATPGEFVCSVTLDAGHIQQSPKMIPVHWSCPNKPCAHTQSCLHEDIRKQRNEIYALKKELAAMKGEAFTEDPALEDGDEE